MKQAEWGQYNRLIDEHLNAEGKHNLLAHRVQLSSPDSIFMNTFCVLCITNPVLQVRRLRLRGEKGLPHVSRVIE